MLKTLRCTFNHITHIWLSRALLHGNLITSSSAIVANNAFTPGSASIECEYIVRRAVDTASQTWWSGSRAGNMDQPASACTHVSGRQLTAGQLSRHHHPPLRITHFYACFHVLQSTWLAYPHFARMAPSVYNAVHLVVPLATRISRCTMIHGYNPQVCARSCPAVPVSSTSTLCGAPLMKQRQRWWSGSRAGTWP